MGQVKEDHSPQERCRRVGCGELVWESQGLGWDTASGMAAAVVEQEEVVEVEIATHPHLPRLCA